MFDCLYKQGRLGMATLKSVNTSPNLDDWIIKQYETLIQEVKMKLKS